MDETTGTVASSENPSDQELNSQPSPDPLAGIEKMTVKELAEMSLPGQITYVSEDELVTKYTKTTGYSEEFVRQKLKELPGIDNPDFLQAIQQSEVSELPTNFDEKALQAARKQIEETGIFLLGETHGVRENPDIYYTLMKNLGCRALALEWYEGSGPNIEKFLKTGKLKLDNFLGTGNDGRVTPGHFALLQRLQSEGMLDKLILFDPILPTDAHESGKGAELRDSGMAENLRAGLDKSIPTLVIAGSIHANTEETDEDGRYAAKTPMGAHLQKDFSTMRPGKIHYQRGNFYNGGVRPFVQNGQIDTKPSFTLDNNGNFQYSLPEAHAAIVPEV